MQREQDFTYTIDPDPTGGFWIHAHGKYPESSVLAGQYQRVKCHWYETTEEAQAEYPQATVNDSPALPLEWIAPSVPSCPPEGFDPADAGERWDEDY